MGEELIEQPYRQLPEDKKHYLGIFVDLFTSGKNGKLSPSESGLYRTLKAEDKALLHKMAKEAKMARLYRKELIIPYISTNPWDYSLHEPDEWLRLGMNYLITAMRLACNEVHKNPTSLNMFGTINVPITLINGDSNEYHAKYSSKLALGPIHKGAWNQGLYTQGVYDSPIIDFDNSDKMIGGRIGIRWVAKGSPEDEPSKAWWGVIRLYCEYYPYEKGTTNKWTAHVRCDYEKADDYKTSQHRVDMALSTLECQKVNNISKFNIHNGIKAYEIAQKTLDAYIAKEQKSKYPEGVGPFDEIAKRMVDRLGK